jgi:pentatricopeptide repeat protein
MRQYSTPPQLSHLNFLVAAIGQSAQSLDRAFFVLQDIVQKEGLKADITAFNIVISACLQLNDSSRAISTYRDAPSLKVQPNLETFNLLLKAAAIVGHVELAMFILSDLKAAQITPDEETYARVILTCLHQPDNKYDQAFLYLEEMKASGWIPPSGIYASFIKKCVYHSDDRAVMLLEEMERVGYDTKNLKNMISEGRRVGANSKLFDRGEGRYSRRHEARKEEEMETEMTINKIRGYAERLTPNDREERVYRLREEQRDGGFFPRHEGRQDWDSDRQDDRGGRYMGREEKRGGYLPGREDARF